MLIKTGRTIMAEPGYKGKKERLHDHFFSGAARVTGEKTPTSYYTVARDKPGNQRLYPSSR
jgi:hypothetical protein